MSTIEEKAKLGILEDLSFPSLTDREVVGIWGSRRVRMKRQREQFEPLWKNGIGRFFEGIVSGGSDSRMYNSLYEQYDLSVFSRDGLRFNNLRYPLLPAIIMRAMASEVPNRPKANWLAFGENDPLKAKQFTHLFNQVLTEMNSDEEDFEILLDRRVMGTAAVLQYTEEKQVKVMDPKINEKGEVIFEEKSKLTRTCKYKKADIRRVFLDEHCTKTNLDDCNYASYDEPFTKEEFLLKFAKYDREILNKCIETTGNDEAKSVFTTWFGNENSEYMIVTHCWDKLFDRYHIIVNGIHLLNEKSSPIPRIAGRNGKDIPLALAVMYKIPGAPYGYGDSHLTTTFNDIKNLVRVMILEITEKSAKPLMAIDPLSNFDEQGFEWGQDFVRVKPDDVKQLSINPNLKWLYEMDSLADNDVIRSTGININDTTNVDVSETARKTVIRRESQNAIIELNMGYLSNSFFKRIYRLLKDDIRLYYAAQLASGEDIKVRSVNEFVEKDENGNTMTEEVKGYRYFDLAPEDLDLDLELVLELGNIASSRELEKALTKEAVEAAQPFLEQYDPAAMAKWVAEVYGMPESVNKGAGSSANQSPEEVANAQLGPEFLPQHMQQQGEEQAQPGAPAAPGAPAEAPQPPQDPSMINMGPKPTVPTPDPNAP